MMNRDPNQRITIDHVLRHKWLSDHSMRGTVYEMFKSVGDNQNWSPFLNIQINNMRLPPRPPMNLAKRPRLEFMDRRL